LTPPGGRNNAAVNRIDGFAPIGAYGAIGDGRTVALVALDGSIDFLSLPALHCPTVFAALLDPERGGQFGLAPTGDFTAERRYVERTNVLETTFRTADSAVRVTDSLNLQNGALLPWVELARRVEGVEGSVELAWSVAPRFDWGRGETRIRMRRGTPIAQEADGELFVGVHTWDAGEPRVGPAEVSGSFRTHPGSRALLALVACDQGPIAFPDRDHVDARIDSTVEDWRRRIDEERYDGPWRDAVTRSALALELLIYSPDGAIAAAPTTSLPERIGGDRNYDYRYAWVRDSTFTLDALLALGLPEQVHDSFAWLLRAVGRTEPDLRPFYTLEGEVPQRMEELPLRGYRDSRPVRYGNAARSQLQLGSWGDLLETADLYVRAGNAFDDETGRRLADVLDRLAVIWPDEDSGIWELPDLRHYTISKLMCWVAFDRGVRLARDGQLPDAHVDRWSEERERVAEFIRTKCISPRHGSLSFYAGTDDLDAATLRVARSGFAPPDGELVGTTIDAVRRELTAGGPLLYRYTGQEREEGAFLACSFWLVEALARAGRLDEARETMDELLEYGNDLGLLAEEVDPASRELLGNFPQGLSHLGLVTAATAVEEATRAAPRDGAARTGSA
jgi:GH15 family glucan-1,4-alpha-glucosidase